MQARKKIAIEACRKAGKILLDNFGRPIKVTHKGDRDLVSDIDKKAEKQILDLIKDHFPKDGIISEESPHSVSESGFGWIIDPIDGTHNFIHQMDIFGTSVALTLEGKVIQGVIYMPVRDELYLGEKGKGAYRNGKKISVSRRNLSEATLVYDSTIRLNKGPMLDSLGILADKVFNIRMFGSTVRSLTYLAEGKVDIEIEFNDKVWDFASGLLLVEEAGGRCTDFEGNPWTIDTRGYIASNGIVHGELLDLQRRS